MSEEREPGSAPRSVELLSRAARRWADAEPAAAAESGSWPAMEGAVAHEERRRGRVRKAVALGGGGLAVALALVTLGIVGREPAVSFVVHGATVAAGGRLAPGTTPARVSFSDGTEVVLQPRSRGAVVATSDRGARVRIDEGRARFAVAHRPEAEWAVDAGPFTVIVHGTVFDLDWSSAPAALVVDLMAGKVTVKGPLPGGFVVLEPGQRLVVRPTKGEMRVDRTSSASVIGGGAAATTPPPAAGSVAAPAVEARPVETAPAEAPEIGGGSVAEAPSSSSSSTPRPSAASGKAARAAARRAARLAAAAPASRPEAAEAPSLLVGAASSWGRRVAAGEFHAVVAEAEELGVARCVAELGAEPLAALADAARYARRPELARRVLLAQRRRFAGTAAAHDAAFLIGRMAEDSAHDRREALAWYDRYLSEGGRGTYASEALGRKMLALDALDEPEAAAATAARYLAEFPDGIYAARARHIGDR